MISDHVVNESKKVESGWYGTSTPYVPNIPFEIGFCRNRFSVDCDLKYSVVNNWTAASSSTVKRMYWSSWRTLQLNLIDRTFQTTIHKSTQSITRLLRWKLASYRILLWTQTDGVIPFQIPLSSICTVIKKPPPITCSLHPSSYLPARTARTTLIRKTVEDKPSCELQQTTFAIILFQCERTLRHGIP